MAGNSQGRTGTGGRVPETTVVVQLALATLVTLAAEPGSVLRIGCAPMSE